MPDLHVTCNEWSNPEYTLTIRGMTREQVQILAHLTSPHGPIDKSGIATVEVTKLTYQVYAACKNELTRKGVPCA